MAGTHRERVSADEVAAGSQARICQRWEPAPLKPALAKGAVHVWRADLRILDGALEDLLSPDERERAAHLANAEGRRLWARSRGLLRALLGRYLDSDPRRLRFETGPHGKPALLGATPDVSARASAVGAATGARPPLCFNLSHSGPFALYAIAGGVAVGVDLELDRRVIDEVALAARMLGEAQARRLQGLEQPERRREFLRAWVRHEAAVKCLGLGIAAAEGEAIDDRRLWSCELDLGGEGAAALVAEREPRELCCWEWAPSVGGSAPFATAAPSS